ncbi:MAG: hypothetical protein JNL28_02020 [Planctomycetes bacterium]|nr:hypothetical protein [Planctomycetota bacterium]
MTTTFLRACSCCTLLLAACVSVDLDESDRDAHFYELRVRKQLGGGAVHEGAHLELGARSVAGSTDVLDYSLQTAAFGIGVDGALGERGWAGVTGGLLWQRSSFELPTEDLGSQHAAGPYLALQGGWMATPWLEPFARAEAAFLFREFISVYSLELGLRLHLIDHAALFCGWRRAHYLINDFDEPLGIEQVELDLRGLVFGLELAF